MLQSLNLRKISWTTFSQRKPLDNNLFKISKGERLLLLCTLYKMIQSMAWNLLQQRYKNLKDKRSKLSKKINLYYATATTLLTYRNHTNKLILTRPQPPFQPRLPNLVKTMSFWLKSPISLLKHFPVSCFPIKKRRLSNLKWQLFLFFRNQETKFKAKHNKVTQATSVQSVRSALWKIKGVQSL